MPKKNQTRAVSKRTSRSTPSLVAIMCRKNVTYSRGIPRSFSNIEQTYRVVLIGPQLNLTFSAGGIATASSLDPTVRLDTWSRWAAVFKQFLVSKVTVSHSLLRLGTAQGQVFLRIEETSAVPTSAIVRSERAILGLVNYQDPLADSALSTWKPMSTEDLAWTDTSASFNLAYLKTYADATNTGTAAADSTTIVSHTVEYEIHFRYLF
jgi:hypothetical protein